MPSYASQGDRVQISFNVAVPDGGPETKTMGNTPTIDPDGFYVAVFGGSGYFNEWVKATVVSATTNYNSTNTTKYTLSALLSVSDSRLRVHFIANCPAAIRSNPPISGSQDTEDNVMSKIRSQKSESYNDGYWQKVILPNGVKAVKDPNNDKVWIPTAKTLEQFPDPIVMVRNFARVYLRNLTPIVGETGSGHQLVTIKKYGLAYAPAEGLIAPMLSAPYTSNASGEPISVIDDEEDPNYDPSIPIYYENFFINYQNYPISSSDPSVTLLTGPPFNYGGFSPSDQSYDYYPNNTDKGAPVEADLQAWDNEHPENNVLYVYERTMPSAARRATRVIIKAERIDQNNVSDGERFYALDIVNTEGRSIALLRNQTYTVHLLNIEADSGESDINKASTATSASVTGDPNFQNLINISDGKSSIGTSFTEKFYVQPQEDFVMFRYIPTNINEEVNGVTYTANKEYLDLVTVGVGSVDTQTGFFTAVTPADAASQGNLSFVVENNQYKVWIDVDNNGKAIPYVRANNTWTPATTAQINDASIEKWGMVKYQLNQSYKDDENYFTQERSQAINITGSFNGRDMSRNVIIKTSPRQDMRVSCQQKYVMQQAGETEVVRILIPTGLSRSVFPLEFDIEPDGYSLTPDGDALPVAYGTSIIPDNDKPSFYFVKTLTEDDYKTLPTTTENGSTWKVIDCHFKTTLSQNECTVYVRNRYFTETNAYDDFHNFVQRLFTTSAGSTTLSLSPTAVYRHGHATLEFVLDYAHRNNTCVWWDPQNTLGRSANAAEAAAKGLSTSNRVLPPIFTVELLGFTPQYEADGETPVTRGLNHVSGNKYSYNVGSGDPTSTMASVTLDLTGSGVIGTTAMVKLSTENLTENPNLYAINNTASTTLLGASFSTVRFGQSNNTTIDIGLGKTVTFTFTYTSGMVVPITVELDGLEPVPGNVENNAYLSSNGNGTYTFTPANTNTTTYYLSLRTTKRFSACTASISHEDYVPASATANRSASFTIPANALYARNGAGNGAPTGYSNNITMYLNSNPSYTNLASSTFNNSYVNNNQMSVSISNFTIVDDDAPVYFIYRTGNNNNYTYYYAPTTLSAVCDATASNRLTLLFKGNSVTITPSSTNNTTSGQATISFARGSGSRDPNYYGGNYGIELYSGNTATVSVSSGYKLTGVVIQETTSGNTSYNGNFTCSTGTISTYDSSKRVTWSASDNSTTSVVFTSQGSSSSAGDIDCTYFVVSYEAL